MDAKNDRRKFLKLLLTGGAVAAWPAGAAGETPDQADKVTLLTEDGRLVELDKNVLDRIRSGKKASDPDIHDFIKPDPKPDK